MADKDLPAACVFELYQHLFTSVIQTGDLTPKGLLIPPNKVQFWRQMIAYREFGDLPLEHQENFRMMAKAYFYAICDQITNEEETSSPEEPETVTQSNLPRSQESLLDGTDKHSL
jgi:hypothetical protein